MSWAKFADDFHQNGKILALSHPAFRLYVCSVTYCAAQRAERGHMTKVQVDALCRLQAVPAKAVKEIEAAGLWEATENGGYLIHDFDVYNPPKSDASNNERQARFRERQKDPQQNNAANNANTTPPDNVTNNAKNNVTGNVTKPLHNGPSRVDARPCPDPTRPDPSVCMSDLTDSAGVEGPDGAETSAQSSGQSSSDLIFIEETLREHPEWQKPLDEQVGRSKPPASRLLRFKRSVLQNWKIGDGTPQSASPPGPTGTGDRNTSSNGLGERPSTVADDPEFLKFQALKKARREGANSANAPKVAVAA